MNFIKKFFTHPSSIIWLSTTVVLVALMTTATVLTGGTYYNVITSALGHKRAITSSGDNVNLFENDSGIATKAEALANANAVNQKIVEEGIVLLKNDNALPLSKNAKVSVFGQNSVNLVYGGSGSAAPKSGEANKTIFDSLNEAGFSYNPALKDFYEHDGHVRSTNPGMDSGGSATLSTGEAPISEYSQSLKDSYSDYSDAALVVFSRIAGEGWDLPRVANDDPNGHYLQLDANERALLKHICDSNCFQHVIVLINSSNMIDTGFLKFSDNPGYQSKIDGCLLIGSVGGQGIMALGRILNGSVTPSGHCVDTLYTHYEEDPTWQNFGDNRVTNSDTYTVNGEAKWYNFVDYEENIYVGYRYYETRGHIEGENWYNSHVVYPFGYGLSYTSFEETLLNKSVLESSPLTKEGDFTVDVKVKNTGSAYSGKDVVELYANAPYTAGGIEKPYKVLIGYAKSKKLAPQEEDTLHIKVNPYYLASYDADDKNGNGFKGYELEKGNYTFFVSENAHQENVSFQKELPEDIRYDKDPVTGHDVVNLFDDADDHLQERLSRSDFAGTFPKMPIAKDREVSADWLAEENNRDSGNDETYDAMPTMDAPVTTTLRDLVGKSYNDPLWDKFLDQMSFQEMVDLFNSGCYSTLMLQRLGVPGTTSFDGPTGIVAFSGDPAVYGTCYYCSECLVAQTWNVDLATKQGEAIGNECLIGNEKGDGLPYCGWYGPGVNLHRSPFGGRNTEYYSEDPFLSGRCAATVIKAVQKYGVYANVKHFCLNDMETHRDTEGKNYWVNEQAIRELYLRPFEMAVKEGQCHGVMSAFTRIGQKWTGGDYRLLTKVLRQEWGFVGSVICDYHVNDYMNNKQMVYAGGDINLTADKPWRNPDSESIGDVSVLRRSSHNLLYTIANSNAMRLDILGYKLPIWQEVLFISDGVISVGLAVWGFFVIYKLVKKKPQTSAENSEKTDSNKPKAS